MHSLIPHHLSLLGIPDVTDMLHAFGPWVLLGIAVLIFIESGVLFPFLPGDSLLVTAAVVSGKLGVNPWLIAVVGSVAAIVGSELGYWIGDRFGRRFFKDNARILSTKNLKDTEAFFTKYGGLSLILGRFVPIVRTYVPLAAGIGEMRQRTFFWWNSAGAIIWNFAMVAVGLLFARIPVVANNIDAIMILIIVVTVLPMVIGVLRRRSRDKKAARMGTTNGAASTDAPSGDAPRA